VSGSAGPALGNDGRTGRHRAGATARASATARVGVLQTATGPGAGRPTASVTAAPSSAGASTVTASPSAGSSTSDTPGAGTLSVSPATLNVAPPASGSITLTASGGNVNWSISEPDGLEKKIVVAPMSGTLAAGQSTTVSVTVQGAGKPRVHLTFSPSGATVTVVIS
jgi:hypothetical protein